MIMKTKDVMVYLPNQKYSFRCDCGCNVFRKIKKNKYKCNACEMIWVGEK